MSKTILLAEDDENDVIFFKMAAKRAGLSLAVQVAQDGKKVVNYLAGENQYADRAQFPLPLFVLLDLKLPLFTGFEVLEWVRSRDRFRTLPIIILTSSTEDRDIEKAYLLGANAFLVKPANPDSLIEVAKALDFFWNRLNRLPAHPLPGMAHKACGGEESSVSKKEPEFGLHDIQATT